MKAHLLAITAALAGLPLIAATPAAAQQRTVAGPRITLPTDAHNFSWEGGHHLRGGFFVVEREVPVIIEREVVHEVPVALPPTPPHQEEESKRKPYVVGGTYASLPGGCMKLIEEAASYYYCGGNEWYRQLGDGRDIRYRAVARP